MASSAMFNNTCRYYQRDDVIVHRSSEPSPNWITSLDTLGWAWPIHVYGFAALFSGLSIYVILIIIRDVLSARHRRHATAVSCHPYSGCAKILSKANKQRWSASRAVGVNAEISIASFLLLLCSVSTVGYLLVDPYESHVTCRGGSGPVVPAQLTRLVRAVTFSLLVGAVTVVQLAILYLSRARQQGSTAKVKALYDNEIHEIGGGTGAGRNGVTQSHNQPFFYKPCVVMLLFVLHLLLVVLIEYLVMSVKSVPRLILLVSRTSAITWALVVCFLFIYHGIHIAHFVDIAATSLREMCARRQRQRMRKHRSLPSFDISCKDIDSIMTQLKTNSTGYLSESTNLSAESNLTVLTKHTTFDCNESILNSSEIKEFEVTADGGESEDADLFCFPVSLNELVMSSATASRQRCSGAIARRRPRRRGAPGTSSRVAPAAIPFAKNRCWNFQNGDRSHQTLNSSTNDFGDCLSCGSRSSSCSCCSSCTENNRIGNDADYLRQKNTNSNIVSHVTRGVKSRCNCNDRSDDYNKIVINLSSQPGDGGDEKLSPLPRESSPPPPFGGPFRQLCRSQTDETIVTYPSFYSISQNAEQPSSDCSRRSRDSDQNLAFKEGTASVFGSMECYSHSAGFELNDAGYLADSEACVTPSIRHRQLANTDLRIFVPFLRSLASRFIGVKLNKDIKNEKRYTVVNESVSKLRSSAECISMIDVHEHLETVGTSNEQNKVLRESSGNGHNKNTQPVKEPNAVVLSAASLQVLSCPQQYAQGYSERRTDEKLAMSKHYLPIREQQRCQKLSDDKLLGFLSNKLWKFRALSNDDKVPECGRNIIDEPVTEVVKDVVENGLKQPKVSYCGINSASETVATLDWLGDGLTPRAAWAPSGRSSSCAGASSRTMSLSLMRDGRRVGRCLKAICFITMALFIGCILQTYAALGVYGVLSRRRVVEPWPWFIYQSLLRMVELLVGFGVVWISHQLHKPSGIRHRRPRVPVLVSSARRR